MAIVNPVSDAYEALLATPTTRAAVFPTTASNFEVALDALLTRTTSKRTTEPLVELEPPVEERYASLPGETDDVEERSETEVLEELPTIAQHTRATTTRRAIGSEDAFQSYLSEELHRALALLTPRERSVITLRYGIGDGRSRTLLETGKELGISRERVRQLEVVALKKLRPQL